MNRDHTRFDVELFYREIETSPKDERNEAVLGRAAGKQLIMWLESLDGSPENLLKLYYLGEELEMAIGDSDSGYFANRDEQESEMNAVDKALGMIAQLHDESTRTHCNMSIFEGILKELKSRHSAKKA